MKCPVCKQDKIMLMHTDYKIVSHPQALYQISYPGEKEYVSPRCEACYEKLIKKRQSNETKKRN